MILEELLKINQTHRDAQIVKIFWCYFWGSMQILGIFRLTWDIFHTAWYLAKIHVFMMSDQLFNCSSSTRVEICRDRHDWRLFLF